MTRSPSLARLRSQKSAKVDDPIARWFCVASCCTCCPKASSASPLWLLANRRRATLLPLCFHFSAAVQPSQTEPEPSPVQGPSPLWLCPKCGGPMWSSRDYRCPAPIRSPPFRAEPLMNYNCHLFTRCVSPPAAVVALFWPPNQLTAPTSPRTFAPTPRKRQLDQSCLRSCYSTTYFPSRLITQPHLNLHKCLPRALPSNSCIGRAHKTSPSLPAHLLWAHRYSTSVSG